MGDGPRAIGFWNGAHTPAGWPEIERFVDPDWGEDERDFIASYLNHGVLGRLYMGYSTCRVCGKKDNGDSEYSDGTYVWPSGFAHYVLEHQVRPPDEFVQHAINMTTALEGERDESWWRGFAG
ncbi:hypothetical protein [Knoellia sp. LjRoot47]|uniref:hypothetical protein n=1 Tax=Knoellia sp. LjRoot47 TaxID=3342330 RepID=UPI003ECD82C5